MNEFKDVVICDGKLFFRQARLESCRLIKLSKMKVDARILPRLSA
jgi:hypothetical protein